MTNFILKRKLRSEFSRHFIWKYLSSFMRMGWDSALIGFFLLPPTRPRIAPISVNPLLLSKLYLSNCSPNLEPGLESPDIYCRLQSLGRLGFRILASLWGTLRNDEQRYGAPTCKVPQPNGRVLLLFRIVSSSFVPASRGSWSVRSRSLSVWDLSCFHPDCRRTMKNRQT